MTWRSVIWIDVMRIYFCAIALLFLTVFSFSGCGSEKRKNAEQLIVAKVNDEKFTIGDLRSGVPSEFSQHITIEQWLRMVSDWVDEQLLVNCAKDLGAESDADVTRKIVIAQRQIMIDYLRNSVVSPRIKITDDDVENYYLSHQGDFAREVAEVHALHILVKSKAVADSVKKFLDADSSFNDIAKRYSIECSPVDSSDLGWFVRSDILPDLVKYVFSAKPGEYAGPAKVGDDYHFFFIIEREDEGTVRSIEQVKDKIWRMLFAIKFADVFENLLDSLRTTAAIEIDSCAIATIMESKDTTK